MTSEHTRPTDPLLDLILRYRRQCDSYNDLECDDNGLELVYSVTITPLWLQLRDRLPAATTYIGAIEALRLCVEDMSFGDSDIHRPLAAAALAYLDQEVR